MLNKIKAAWAEQVKKIKKGKKETEADDFNPNQDNQKKVILIIALLGACGLLYCVYRFVFGGTVSYVQSANKNYIKIKDNTFTEEDNTTALSHQQASIDALKKSITEQTEKIKQLTEAQAQQKTDLSAQKTELKAEITSVFTQSSKEKPTCESAQCLMNKDLLKPEFSDRPFSKEDSNALGEGQPHTPMPQTTLKRFSNPFMEKPTEETPKYKRTWKNFVPTGTFCRAVILGGADAHAGVEAQGDTAPIMFKVLNRCVLPNGKYSQLKGAFITASTYGQMSSERGMVRLDNLSLTKKDGSILDIPVEGTAFDVGGKNGIRGIPDLRNGKVIQASGAAGFISGIGGALSQSTKTTSVSALGATESINGMGVFKAGLGQGTQSALGKIADYYLKLAEQYSPIIPLNPGAMVDIVFLKGFPIEDEEKIKRYEEAVSQSRTETKLANQAQTLQIPTPPNLGTKTPLPSYNQIFNAGDKTS